VNEVNPWNLIQENRSARALAAFSNDFFERIKEKGGHYRGPFMSSNYTRGSLRSPLAIRDRSYRCSNPKIVPDN
jgi:hypothetical protein